MDLTNLKNGVGFVTQNEMLLKMSRFPVPKEDNFALRRIIGTSFSEVCVMFRGKTPHRLFRICTVNRDLFYHVEYLFHKAAEQLQKMAVSDKWEATDDGNTGTETVS